MNWQEIIERYIAKHANRIKKTTRPLKDHFGIGYFTYHRIDNEGKYTVLVDRPDWAEHYVSKQLFLNDPYLRHPSMYRSGINLMENQGSKEYKTALVQEGKTVLNMDTGILLIQKQDDCTEFFGFCGNKTTSALSKLYLNHPQLLKSFAHHFKKELSPIIAQMNSEASSLVHLKGEDFFYNQPIYPEIDLSTRLAYYKDLGMPCGTQKLSSRERQCLKLLYEGLSAKETAAVLGLSRRTVEFYFENIKDKLACWSKQELFKIAKNLEELELL